MTTKPLFAAIACAVLAACAVGAHGNAYAQGYGQGGYGYPPAPGYGGGYGDSYGDENGLPPGSYLQSCRDIVVRRGMLEATCGGDNGGRRTAIPLNSCRSGNFENINGNLQCAGGGDYGRNNRDLPPGTYLQSCRDIRIRGDVLEAVCGSGNGNVRTSISLYSCRSGSFENINGNLQCTGGGGGGGGRNNRDLPPGSYLQSCSDISIRGGVLEASCGGGDNRRVRSSVSLSSCRSGSFSNINGYLQCDR
ncbi:Cyanovirin-N domain protein [Collimonas arenae]|uniref:Cyanovirin-N domain protein n=1 Tax=Collimonas arenae TaxID=279058 RepID=A0A0A1FFD9_9BURK|nr:CVNH domain-containing protein [Collimonas arenae]AIY42374.1 Cyanovirin-N domain protein [Collimonas arenae]